MKKILLGLSLALLLSGCTKRLPEMTVTNTPIPTILPEDGIPSADSIQLTCVEQTLKITDPKPYQTVTLPFTIDGTIEVPDSPDCKRWGVFEGQAGIIEIQQADGKIIHSQPFFIEGEWMTEQPIPFSIVMTSEIVMPQGKVEILFKSDNPSGLPENDQIYSLPIEIN